MREKVSVIIPVYQAEEYLERCVYSVLDQNYENVQIILLDDGSSDDSLMVCRRLADSNEKVQVLHYSNSGVAITRNRGLEVADGEYILFLDSDDWIDKNMLSEMTAALEESNADLCICGFIKYDEDKNKKYCPVEDCQVERNVFIKELFWDLYEKSILSNIGTKLYRRSIIEEIKLRFSENMAIYEDVYFCLTYLIRTQKIAVCAKPFYYYYQLNHGSITHRYANNFWRDTSIYCKLLTDYFGETEASLHRALLTCQYRAYLQESHNPKLTKEELLQKLNDNCFSLADELKWKSVNFMGLTWDKRIFLILVLWKQRSLLWILAFLINKKRIIP